MDKDLKFSNGLNVEVKKGMTVIIVGHIGWRLGEVALCVGFERWEAILPNTFYQQPFFQSNF